jgi:hypothetical protein
LTGRLAQRVAVGAALALVSLASFAAPVFAQECDDDELLATDGDRDGLPDVVERFLGSDPAVADSDLDGVVDGIEVSSLRTDPLAADTDGDGFCDGGDDVAGTCAAGEDRDGDGVVDPELGETNPLCTTYPAEAGREGRERGSSVLACSSTGAGPWTALALLAATGPIRRWLRRR